MPWLVAVAFFMQSLDTTILNTAVPSIARALQVAPLSMKAVLASYTLSLAVFIPVSGWMANRFGTRRVFAGAIGLFALGSLLCGVSRNIHLLAACRVLQGCGGAMMVPVGRLTLVRALPKSQLLRAMSLRTVLISNTTMLGLLIMLFALIGTATPLWLIVVLSFAYGFFQSLQFTSMNTLVYADVSAEAAGSASSIASTAQQLSMSFGVATASLAAALFLPDRFHADAAQMIGGVHASFLVLGVGTIVSTMVFGGLKPTDGSAVSQHRADQRRADLSATPDG